MSTLEQLADHVFEGLNDASALAEKGGLPREAVLASALETSVNILAFKRGLGPMVGMLEQLVDLVRNGSSVEHGWVLAQLRKSA